MASPGEYNRYYAFQFGPVLQALSRMRWDNLSPKINDLRQTFTRWLVAVVWAPAT
jgi:hypothetical protein